MSKTKYSPPRPDERTSVLSQERSRKTAQSSQSFVRGSTGQFYEWLGGPTAPGVPDGPPIWICGDCHVGNLGPVADAGGRVRLHIRDLDHSVIGNPAHDLIRLALSLASAIRGSDLPGVTTARMLEAMMEGYESAIEHDFDEAWDNPDPPMSCGLPCEKRTGEPGRNWPRRGSTTRVRGFPWEGPSGP